MIRNFSLEPVWAMILLTAEVLVLATVAIAIIYLISTFFYSWVTSKKFSTAVETFEANVKKVGAFIAAPFLAIAWVISAIAGKIAALLEKAPWKNSGEFFAWFAGADLENWRKVDSSTRKKRTRFGMLMFVVLIATSTLAGRVWGEVFDSFFAGVIAGIIWFCVMTAIDMSIIIFMDNNSKNWRMVLARLAVVICVSYINTTYIVIEMYHGAIINHIIADKQKEVQHYSDSIQIVKEGYQTERDQLAAEIVAARTNQNNWEAAEQAKIDAQRELWRDHQEHFIQEVAGNVGSGKKGWGDAAKAAKSIADADSVTLYSMIARFDSARANSSMQITLDATKEKAAKRDAELVTLLDKNDAWIKAEETKILDRKQDSYPELYDAMWKEARKRPFNFFMLFMFFFAIESMAVLMKMMGGKDNYDAQLQLSRETFAAENHQAQILALQTGLNAHNLAMNGLIQTSATNQASHVWAMKARMDALTSANVELVKEINNHLSAIEAELASVPDEAKAALREKLMKEYFASLNMSVN